MNIDPIGTPVNVDRTGISVVLPTHDTAIAGTRKTLLTCTSGVLLYCVEVILPRKSQVCEHDGSIRALRRATGLSPRRASESEPTDSSVSVHKDRDTDCECANDTNKPL